MADTLAWLDPGRGSFVTLVAKLELNWVHDGVCTVEPPRPIRATDHRVEHARHRRLEAIGELAPFVPHPEVLVVGSAWVAGSSAKSALSVQVSLTRQDLVLRKHVVVHGDRHQPGEAGTPFRSMPLTWERAVLSLANPVGIDPRARPANVVHPDDPTQAAGFGPLAPEWPPRAAHLADVDHPPQGVEPLELPAQVAGAYFQTAPVDQWLPELVGDEWVGLDGLHPVLPRVHMRLPGVRIGARLMNADWRIVEELPLAADQLVLDSDRQLATLIYRVVAPIELSQLASHTILVGLAEPDGDLHWPNPDDASTRCPHHAKRYEPSVDSGAAPTPASPTRPQHEEQLQRASQLRQPHVPQPNPEEEPFSETQALRALAPLKAALPFRDHVLDPETVDPAPDEAAPDDDPLEGTMQLGRLHHMPKPLPFVAPEPTATDDESATSPAFLSSLATTIPVVSKRGAFDDDEHTAIGQVALLSPVLPFHKQPLVGPSERSPTSDAPRPRTEAASSAVPPSAAPTAPGSTAPAITAEHSASPPPVAGVGPASVFTDGPLAVAALMWRVRLPFHTATVIAKASFDLMHDGPARLSTTPEPLLHDTFDDDNPHRELLLASDFALLKPRVDILVRGHVYAPRGHATHMLATLRLRGRDVLDRTLTVAGNRVWQATGGTPSLGPSKPEPFASLPIRHARAFGGPELANNPVGVGSAAGDGTPLPNFELPSRPICHPGESPHPECFGPINPHWKDRSVLLGDLDANHLAGPSPEIPADFNYSYFQAAPANQRVRALRGDEGFELVGLHPHHDRLRGTLPGARVRCFAELAPRAGGGFIEIPVLLDTLTFDTDASALHMVWRGNHDMRHAGDVLCWFAILERLEEDTPIAEVRARFLALR